jgi:hypothetical protein
LNQTLHVDMVISGGYRIVTYNHIIVLLITPNIGQAPGGGALVLPRIGSGPARSLEELAGEVGLSSDRRVRVPLPKARSIRAFSCIAGAV